MFGADIELRCCRKCFVRVDRPSEVSDKSGKGGWWTYVAQNDPEGRGARGGKGTGEYRKGTTPSDIASRSPSPADGSKVGPLPNDQIYPGGDPNNTGGIDEQDQIAAILNLHQSMNSGNHPQGQGQSGYQLLDEGVGAGYNGAGNGHPVDGYGHGQTLAMAEEALHHDYGSYRNSTGGAREPKSGYT